MNILLINHYAGSIRHGMEYRPFYLAREWVRMGHRVDIVAASCAHVRTVSPEIKGQITHEVIDGVNYTWLKTPNYSGNGVGRVKNMLSFTAQLISRSGELARKFAPDVVIASSTYPLDNYPAVKIAQMTGAKMVYEVHDLWPLSPMEIGGMSPRHPFVMLMQWGENYAYKHCDHVVSMLPLAESHMLEHGLAQGKFNHVPNGIDVDEWTGGGEEVPAEHSEAVRRLREQGRYVVGYVGAHGPANALDYLIEAAGLLQEHPVSFVMVGKGPNRESLMQSAAQLRNVVFLPSVPKAAVPSLLSQMDTLYIGWLPSPLYRFGTSPNKLMDYMMSGKPVVQSLSAGNDLVRESGCGVSVPSEDPRAIADAVLSLTNMDPAQREEMGRRGREYVLGNHDYRVLARRFLDAVGA